MYTVGMTRGYVLFVLNVVLHVFITQEHVKDGEILVRKVVELQGKISCQYREESIILYSSQ